MKEEISAGIILFNEHEKRKFLLLKVVDIWGTIDISNWLLVVIPGILKYSSLIDASDKQYWEKINVNK